MMLSWQKSHVKDCSIAPKSIQNTLSWLYIEASIRLFSNISLIWNFGFCFISKPEADFGCVIQR